MKVKNMSKIGEIRTENREGRTILEGFIGTLDLDLVFDLVPNIDKKSDSAPDYIIQIVKPNGQIIVIGAAWQKTYMDNGNERMMLSITLDDPSFPMPLNVAAFQESDGRWSISFRRRQNKNQK